MFGFLYFLYKLTLFSVFFIGFIILITQLIYLKLKSRKNKIFGKDLKIVSFVHPFCADCGGGEKVLWRMISSLISLNDDPNLNNLETPQKIKINIISGKRDNVEELKEKLKQRFGIELNKDDYFENNYSNYNINNYNIQKRINKKIDVQVELISMRSGYMLRPQKMLTMLFQILAQIYFAFEIITKVYSDVFCDTTGLPFCYFILKYFGHAKVTAYTHYPFISNDMRNQVKHDESGVHSQGKLNKYKIIKYIKLYYYKLILKIYKLMGNKCLSFAYVNSTWTYNHMKDIWEDLEQKKKLLILYPPCSISLYKEAAKNEQRENIIVSFSQFRKEKRQNMQIKILAKLKKKLNIYPEFQDLELHIIGGVRNKDDEAIFNDLINYSRELGVQDYVKLLPNRTKEQILEEFSKAKIGIHTMKDEHFGISLIEMMAAGLILVTHNSAGAKDDILVNYKDENNIGFLVDNENDYINQIEEILLKYNEIKTLYVNSSRKRAEKFSDEAFKAQFINQLKEFLL